MGPSQIDRPNALTFILFILLQQNYMKIESDQEKEHEDERRNPIKRAEKEKEFRTVGQLKDILTNPTELYQCIGKYSKTFKSVKNAHPKYKDLSIIDFSLAARGPQEDEVYTHQPFYRNNIRRGNTVVVDNKNKDISWGRKGLIKFFDISEKILWAIVNSNTSGLNGKDQPLYYCIFGEIENVLSCNEQLQPENQAKVHVYRLNKANGQNAQIGYFPKTNEWVVSSKNVSIFVSDPNDVKLYKEQRYQFAVLMAETWFNLLDGKSKADIEQLKKDLTGKTIIGEYCGNPDYQHLVKYSDVTIFFYAVVDNNSAQTCVSPSETFKLLERHKLPIVKNYEKSYFGKFSSFIEFGQSLLKLFSEVSTSSIFEDEEGSVIYFLLEKPKAFCEYVSDRYLQKSVPIPVDWAERESSWNVCSLGKLKTLQYRILRKLREKLKFFTRVKKGGEQNAEKNQNEQKKLEQKYGSFQREVYSLVKGKQLSKPLEYYFCAAIIAFEYAFKNRKSQRNLQLLSEHYLDFVSVIFWSIEYKKEVTVALMNDQALHKELRATTWKEYSTDIVKDYEEMLSKFAPRYAKIRKSMNVKEMTEDVEEDIQ